MLYLKIRSMFIFILLSILTTMASACYQNVYGITIEDKCKTWWEEASKSGSTTTVLCVRLIIRNCPQMLDVRVSSQSKLPFDTHVSVVTEYLATHKKTGKTIAFDDKTSQELCSEEDRDCALLWRTYTSDKVTPNIKDKCWRLYDRFCSPSRAEETGEGHFGSRPVGSQSRMYSDPSYAVSDLGTRVSSSTKEYKETKSDFSKTTKSVSGNDYSSKNGQPGSYSYDQTSEKHEHSSHEYKETSSTYHKQNTFTLDTSPGSPAAETGLHPVLASLGGTDTTVTEIEDTQRKTGTESSLTKLRAGGGLRDEVGDINDRLGTEVYGRGGLRAEADSRVGLPNRGAGVTDSRVALPNRAATESDSRIGLPNRGAGVTDSRVGLPNRAAKETDTRTGLQNRAYRAQDPKPIQETLSSKDYAPIRSVQPQEFHFAPQKLEDTSQTSDRKNASPPGTVYNQEKSISEKNEFERQEHLKNEGVPSPNSSVGEYSAPARSSNNVNNDYRSPSRSFDQRHEDQCDLWWQEALQQYQSGLNPIDMVDSISQYCPSLLEISSQPIKTVMVDHVNVEILKTVTNKVMKQTIRTSLTRRQDLCSDQDVDCDIYWRIVYHVEIPGNKKQKCFDLIYWRCPKDQYTSSDGRLHSVITPPQNVVDEIKNGRSK